ncbi:uncharacterized protein AB675_8514 [Cyphellophora attinorum]|uniref:Gfo/Idh/MocA-like oxidoreductase C-terminal domain-containing protein n=1 Tax=Cyphellophora attinorum TaxID=1664694 RepID=A0A0N0NQT5_9EURO|nr:uncharacterized protein AB675_8514 [Phialophora attinorum]KPI44288.1 hypothetical protein AB675_8514 [Phialophora attinorum]
MGSISQPAITAKPRFVVIGGGSRGAAYGRAVQASTNGQIAVIAEINPFVREEFGQKYIWGERKPADHESFPSWEAWLEWEQARRKNPSIVADPNYVPVTGAFICTLDESHIASIGHVLRYSPHNIVLRALLLEQQSIGEIVSIEHTEPIGWWHFSHSYVRGNWRHVKPDGVGSLLTKSCHDIDFLMWLLTSPSSLTGEKPHLPSTITSTGHLTQFRKSRKPRRAGNATNCLSCPAADECSYAAQKLYRDHWLRKERDTGWPLKIVVPEIEDIVAKSGWDGAETKLMSRLGEDYDTTMPSSEVEERGWYGRCVYESDNSVVDDQTVVIGWEEDPVTGTPSENGYGRGPKTAVFHMTAPTEAQCDRRGRIYGSQGEISYDSKSISVYTFADRKTITHVIPKQAPEVEKAHGGGDWGLAGAFVRAVEEVDNGTLEVGEAQWRYVGCGLQEIIRSHGVVFAAEEARNKRAVVDWKDFCSRTGCPV